MPAPVRGARALAVVLLSTTAAAGTIHVNGALFSGANDGTSWADAYRSVDAVVVAVNAAVAGDEVWVAAGTYKPTTGTSRTISHPMKNGVSVYGGFAGTETQLAQRDPVANVTILSGDIGIPGNASDNSYHVVDSANSQYTAALDGFRITGGNADGGGFNEERGGGILVMNGGPIVRNCRFVSNRATFGGGACYVHQSSASFADSVFEGNVGGNSGGAIHGSAASAQWVRCSFVANTAVRGGAIEFWGLGNPSLINCLFRDNVATSGGGGALYFDNGYGPWIRNCTVVENRSTVHPAGGIFLGTGGASIANCIVWDNSGPGGAQASVNQISGFSSVQYSLVEGGYNGIGNLNAAPAFVDPVAHDYRLTIVSPGIDAGSNTALIPSIVLDLAGQPRLADQQAIADTGVGSAPIVDIGAYELPASVGTPHCFGDGSATPCPCGNDAPIGGGTGCLNSLGTGGQLAGTGIARISADSFVLHGWGMTSSSCLYIQGTAMLSSGNGAVFGDGLRCAGGSVIRIGTKLNVAGASRYPASGDPLISVRGAITAAGSVRTYQCWYRNAAAFCTPSPFNLTNGLSVTWEL